MLFIFLLLGSSLLFGAQVGKLSNFPYTGKIQCLAASPAGVWAGTSGGIRFATSDLVVLDLFTPTRGLASSDIVSLAVDDKGRVYAVGRDASISVFDPTVENFRTLNLSYRVEGYQVGSSHSFAKGNYLVLGFRENLSFLDLRTGRSALSIGRAANADFSNRKIRDILLKDDTVFVAVDSAIFYSHVNFDNIDSTRNARGDLLNLSDPGSWSALSVDPTLLPLQSLALTEKGVVPIATPGSWSRGPGGFSRAFSGSGERLVLEGDSILDPRFFMEFSEGESGNAQTMLALDSSGSWWTAGPLGLFRMDENAVLVADPFTLPFESVHQIITGEPLLLQSNQNVWTQGVQGWLPSGTLPPAPVIDYDGVALRSTVLDGGGSLVTGSFGFGIYRESEYLKGSSADRDSNSYLPDNSCIEAHDEPVYTVVHAALPFEELGGTFFSYWPSVNSNRNYGLAFLAESGELLCLPDVGSSRWGGAMVAVDSAGEYGIWVSSYTAVDRFRIERGEKLSLQREREVNVQAIGHPVALELDGEGRLWVLTPTSLAVVNGDTVEDFTTAFGFRFARFTDMEYDGAGGMWVTSSNQGAWYLNVEGSEFVVSDKKSYGMAEGLLSNLVWDVYHDAKTGKVWFGHDNGLSLYESRSRSTETFMTAKGPTLRIFPNPFRPGVHTRLTVDGLAEDAVVRFYDAAGNPVRVFSGTSLRGGVLWWDGRNRSGNFLSSGVYHMVVSSSRGKLRRKLLVVR